MLGLLTAPFQLLLSAMLLSWSLGLLSPCFPEFSLEGLGFFTSSGSEGGGEESQFELEGPASGSVDWGTTGLSSSEMVPKKASKILAWGVVSTGLSSSLNI
ncbi:uncharacterized protein FIBRA_09168 [Fibroporia radiculosa]|uniref:Secreted protein n=1 Tax=Fibroporia radiculosa TaxID=599839 RepID=J4I3Y0_9APHY|nr:uncharacterized protein FIBRA_09168 [Fibroporia radiculosa]CCM06862.1 predicted protein [Fibroporia radiculosa]